MSSGASAATSPTLPPTEKRRAPTSTGSARTASTRSATASASSAPTSSRANSSPPRRATASPGPASAASRRPTSHSTWSPAACPWVSLMSLKSSRSTYSTTTSAPVRRRAVRAASSRVSRKTRLPSPVSGSERAWCSRSCSRAASASSRSAVWVRATSCRRKARPTRAAASTSDEAVDAGLDEDLPAALEQGQQHGQVRQQEQPAAGHGPLSGTGPGLAGGHHQQQEGDQPAEVERRAGGVGPVDRALEVGEVGDDDAAHPDREQQRRPGQAAHPCGEQHEHAGHGRDVEDAEGGRPGGVRLQRVVQREHPAEQQDGAEQRRGVEQHQRAPPGALLGAGAGHEQPQTRCGEDAEGRVAAAERAQQVPRAGREQVEPRPGQLRDRPAGAGALDQPPAGAHPPGGGPGGQGGLPGGSQRSHEQQHGGHPAAQIEAAEGGSRQHGVREDEDGQPREHRGRAARRAGVHGAASAAGARG